MNDTYVEVLVKRKDSLVGKFLRTFTLILAAMFAIFGIILSPVIFIGAIIFGAIHYVARLRTEVGI
jgi:mannose/fructose/N-acetylgalactosamine-specific phosphotransferase system component IID